MRAVVQRVTRASVSVSGETIASIDHGLVALVGISSSDAEADRAYIADKLVHVRVFEDERQKMNLDVQQAGGSLLLVPNFTVVGATRRGRRPSFDAAMAPAEAEIEFDRLLEAVRARAVAVAAGRFGADMSVEIANDGPVTLVLDSRDSSQVMPG